MNNSLPLTILEHRPCWCGGACPHIALACELEKQKRPRLAEIELHRVLVDNPDCRQARSVLARILANENRAAFALEHLDTAIGTAGPDPELIAQRAIILRQGAEIPMAIGAARERAIAAPDDVWAQQAYLLALQLDGCLTEAQSVVFDLDRRFPGNVHLRRFAALIEADSGDHERALARLQQNDLTALELFDRGRIHEKLKHYREAWQDWMTAKAMQRKAGARYNHQSHARHVAELCDTFTASRMRYLFACDMPAERPWPIFITGFPRSGTTMIEATLSSHPQIVAGDELPFLLETIQRMPAWLRVNRSYPKALMASSLPENAMMLSLLRDFYQRKSHAKIGPGVAGMAYFTDKMPSNEKHWPLIRLLFPQSPIVHLRRHPLDIIVSNMSHFLTHGGFVACALEWCASHMLLLDDLMAFYQDNIAGLEVAEVRYEDFTRDHRAIIDRMLPADLPRDPRCYDFHLNAWHSRTISARQIKKPVNAGSVGRYLPFLEFLEPILPIIEPVLRRHRYRA